MISSSTSILCLPALLLLVLLPQGSSLTTTLPQPRDQTSQHLLLFFHRQHFPPLYLNSQAGKQWFAAFPLDLKLYKSRSHASLIIVHGRVPGPERELGVYQMGSEKQPGHSRTNPNPRLTSDVFGVIGPTWDPSQKPGQECTPFEPFPMAGSLLCFWKASYKRTAPQTILELLHLFKSSHVTLSLY